MEDRLEKKDPLWVKYHMLFDSIIHKKIKLAEAINQMLKIASVFLEKYTEPDELKEIIVAFENMKDNILAKYGEEAIELYENEELDYILEGFDSRIFEGNYSSEIDKLKIL